MKKLIRMYPEETATMVEGKPYERFPTKTEVLAYFAHPLADLEDYRNWSCRVANQRLQLNRWKFTAEDIASVLPEHRHLFIDVQKYRDAMAARMQTA